MASAHRRALIERPAGVFLWSILIALVMFGIALCSGLMPPDSVVIAIVAGILVGPTLFAIGWKKLALGLCVGAAGLIIFLLRPGLDVRSPTSDDPIHDDYFGIENTPGTKYRNVAVVEGVFTLRTWLSARLCRVNKGAIEQLSDFYVGRSPNQIGASRWENMKITVVLGDRLAEAGRVTQLGSWGHSRGLVSMAIAINNMQPVVIKSVSGRLCRAKAHVVYAESDQEFDLEFSMTAEDFAKRNKGDCLIVEVVLN